MLVSLQDPSRVKLIDYGISCARYKGSEPKRYNPEAERRQITGTLTWASLNAHHGICKYFCFPTRVYLNNFAFIRPFMA